MAWWPFFFFFFFFFDIWNFAFKTWVNCLSNDKFKEEWETEIGGPKVFTESQNCGGWKGPQEILESNSPAKAGTLQQVTQVATGPKQAI